MQARARAVMLTNYIEVARHFGLDPYAMLGRPAFTRAHFATRKTGCRPNRFFVCSTIPPR
jgi:hypothetical protein